MDIIVQKYGGTSMADAMCIKNVAKKVVAAKQDGFNVAVVVSAPAGVTDYLVNKAKEITDRPHGRELDMILSTGEQISISLLAMAIEDLGENAISFTSAQVGIYTDNNHNNAKIEAIDTSKIEDAFNKSKIVIIAGFQGVTKKLEITTLGRGGSDTSAVALGVALGAKEVEIYTDVEGVYTADPRMVPNAHKIDFISFDEMLEMAGSGAKVLHLRSVELAAKSKLPIHLRSSFNDKIGTYVIEENNLMEQVLVRGVAHTTNNAKITISNFINSSKNVAYIFNEIANRNINVDVITQNYFNNDKITVSFTVSEEDYERTLLIANKLGETVGAESVFGKTKIAKVSIIGVGMKSTAGIASRVFDCLAKNGIHIEMVSTSDINITCIINEEQCQEAVLAIHLEFNL